MRQQGINGLRGVRAGSCHAWPLPADATCAMVARQVFRDAVAGIGLEPGLLDNCVLMAGELAANTLHARAVAGTGGGGDRLVSVAPDRGGEPISAAGPATHSAATPTHTPRTPDAAARLIDVTGLRVYTLSADVTATRVNERLSARQAAGELEAMLEERGFHGHLVRADQPASDMSVLSVCHGLTVWCRSGFVSLTTVGGGPERWNYADLVEAAEQTVRRYEELGLSLDLAAAEA